MMITLVELAVSMAEVVVLALGKMKVSEALPVGILYNFESLMFDERDYRSVYETMMQVLT